MKYTTKPKYYKVKNESKTYIKLTFPSVLEDIIYKNEINFLLRILYNYNNTYRTIEENRKFVDESYIMDIDYDCTIIGKNMYIDFYLDIPKSGLVKEFDIDSVFNYLHEMIYNPYLENGCFNEKIYNFEKAKIDEYYSELLYNPKNYCNNEFYKCIDPEDIEKNIFENEIEFFKTFTNKRLYELYQKYILNVPCCVTIAGSYKKSEIDTYLKKYNFYSNKTFEYPIINKPIFHSKFNQDFYNEKDFNKAILIIEYEIKDYKLSEKYMSILLENLLNCFENNLLLKALRYKYQLVYSASARNIIENGQVIINMNLQYQNKQKVIDAIQELFDELKNIDFLKECVERNIRGVEIELLGKEDNEYYPLIEIEYKMRGRYTLKELLDLYKNIDFNQFADFINRIELKNTLLVGVDHNEK